MSTDKLYVDRVLLGADRHESNEPMDYRMAVYPDGRQVLQGGYWWQEGLEQGITWRDLPVVPVDDQGRELGMAVPA